MAAGKTHLVEFVQDGNIYVKEDEPILTASLAAGIPHFHVCGGNAKCSTCRVLVHQGAESLAPPNEKEQALNSQMHFPPNVRLACQTRVIGGPVLISRIIRDESDLELYVGSDAGSSTQEMGAERELVLFFLDVRDFTAFVENQLPFDVIHIIRKLFAVFQNAIEKNSGRILETAGDGIYAVFGCAEGIGHSADAAVQAAFYIFAELDRLNETYFQTHFKQLIQIGIGIHVGKVISGNVRIGNEERTIVMGYPVNIASRLQDATKQLDNNLVVSDAIYDLLKHPKPGAEATSIRVKGVASALSVYPMGKPYRHSKK